MAKEAGADTRNVPVGNKLLDPSYASAAFIFFMIGNMKGES